MPPASPHTDPSEIDRAGIGPHAIASAIPDAALIPLARQFASVTFPSISRLIASGFDVFSASGSSDSGRS